jgi:transcription termination factor NusB
MNEAQKKRIEKNIDDFCELQKICNNLEQQIDSAQERLSKIESDLYEDKPKEYLRDVIECLKGRAELEDNYNIKNLLFDVENHYNKNDEFIEDHLKYSPSAEKMLGQSKKKRKQDEEKVSMLKEKLKNY